MADLTHEERQKEKRKAKVNRQCVYKINEHTDVFAEYEYGKQGFYLDNDNMYNVRIHRNVTDQLQKMGLAVSFVKDKGKRAWVEVQPYGHKSWKNVHEELGL